MNDADLIAKKEVLDKMGISYGQLYRWKRKGLIPENWFVRRSTFTGQETFFPRDKIIDRIERIKEMKDEHPLDELAGLITKAVTGKLEVAFSQLRELGWLDEKTSGICGVDEKDVEAVCLRDVLCLGAANQLSSVAGDEEIELVVDTLEEILTEKSTEQTIVDSPILYLLRKKLAAAGISAEISMAVVGSEDIKFDPETQVVKQIDLRAIVDRIKLNSCDSCKEE